MPFCSKIPCLLCSLFPKLEFPFRVKQLSWYRQYVLIPDFNAKNKIRKGRGGRGRRTIKMQMNKKRVDENEGWVSFKNFYGFRESKYSPILKCKQDLRTILWVRTPKAPLELVAEAWYHQCRGLWATTQLSPFPRSLWCLGPAWGRQEVQQASTSERPFESGRVGLLPSAKIQQLISTQPHSTHWDVPPRWGSAADHAAYIFRSFQTLC